MHTAWKIIGGVLVCLILLLGVLRATGLNPHGVVPGLWLNGNHVTTPVADWSYTDKYQTDMLQTRTWYGLPHSVTTWNVAYNGQLYLATSRADIREWPRNVARDPHVRLKIGDQLFDCTLVVVTDPAERAGVPVPILQGKSSQFDVLIRGSNASGKPAPRTLPMHKAELRRQDGALVRGKNGRGFSRHAGGSIRPMWGEV
jgi:hypothetical protein